MKNKLNSDFLDKLSLLYTKKELEIIEAWFNAKRNTVFRINSLKNDYDVLKNFEWYWYEIEKIDFLPNSYKILKEGTLKLSLMKSFKKWYIYVQWITSQIPVELIDLPEDTTIFRVLDLTSAPGWKSTQISSRLNNTWEIIANESNTIRFDKLLFTVNKQGSTNIEVTKFDANNLPETFLEWYFDVIIADLPCSAEWRISLDTEKTYKFLEKQWVNKRNYKIQQSILKNNIKLLKSGGQLIYSTCTLDPLENEWIVHFLLSNFTDLEIQNIDSYFENELLSWIIKKWITEYKKYIFKKEVANWIRLLPSEMTEWFFVSKFIKK